MKEEIKKKKGFIALLSFAIIISIAIFKNQLSDMLRGYGASYTLSHFTPYILVLFFSFAVTSSLLKQKSKAVRLLIRIPIATLLFLSFVIQYPIYHADIVSSSRTLNETIQKDAYSGFNGVVMLALPGCGHCEEAMPDYGKFQTDNPELDARFFLMSKRSENLKFYLNEFPTLKRGSLPSDVDQKYLWKQTIGVFPSYLEFKNGLPVKCWTANEFGVRAKDQILK